MGLTMKRRSVSIYLTLLLWSLLSIKAFADDNWYASANVGLHSYYDRTDPQYIGDFDSHGRAYRLMAGYQFDPYFSVEGGYANLGQYALNGLSFNTSPLPVQRYINNTIRPYGLIAEASAQYPFVENWSVLLRAGDFLGHVSNDSGASASGTRFTYGTGIDWAYSERIRFQLTWDRYNNIPDTTPIGNFYLTVVGLGLVYNFQ